MIQGINSDYDPYLSTTSVYTNSVVKTSDSDNEKKADGTQSAKTDTVEISTQARAAMQKANSVVSVGGKTSAENSTNQQNSGDTAQLPAAKATAKVTAKTTDTSTTQQTSLSGLSEMQMDKLVAAGTITKSEEQQELAKRAAEKQQQESAPNQKTQFENNPMPIL